MPSRIQLWRSFLFPAVLMATLVTGISFGESICSRGPRGLLQSPCVRFVNSNNPRTQFGFTRISQDTPDLVANNGNLFENSPTGPRQLMVDLRPGRQGFILGASNGNVVQQVLNHLGRIVSSLSGQARQLAQLVLQRHGRNPNGTGGGLPPGPVASGTGDEPRPTTNDQHGQGNVGDSASRRPAVEVGRLVDDSTGKALPSTCRNLHDAICGGTNREADRRADENRALDLLGQFRRSVGLSRDAFVQVMQGILDTQPQRNAAFPSLAVRNDRQQVVTARDVFNQLVNFLTNGSAASLPSVQRIKDTMNDVRNNLVAAIDKMDFPDPNAKQALRNKAMQTTLRMVPRLDSLRSIKEFVEGCGPDGMTVSAFALPDTNEMMVCPGLLLASGRNESELVDSLIHVAAHEWGHNLHIPQRRFFRAMENCFTQAFRSKGFLPKQTEEAVADSIGAAALAERVRGKSAAETLRILRASTNILCFTTGKDRDGQPDEHPPGVFRINNLIGRNPTIMEALGCGQPTAEEPACLVQGKVPAQ